MRDLGVDGGWNLKISPLSFPSTSFPFHQSHLSPLHSTLLVYTIEEVLLNKLQTNKRVLIVANFVAAERLQTLKENPALWN
jgi:hypothetical protein